MRKILSNEAKTGIMVVVCAALLLALVSMAKDFSFFEKGYEVKVIFDYVGGIEQGAPVRVAGVEAGQVKEIILTCGDKTQAELLLMLDPKAKIRQDSKINISTLGLMGEKYVEIDGGSEGTAFVAAGSTIVGVNPMKIEDFIDLAKSVANNIDLTLQDVRKLANSANSAIADNREKIDQIVSNLNTSSENLVEFTDDVKRHPWKLFIKGKEKKIKDKTKEENLPGGAR
ncbi:MAG: MlaD family protein [Candidatus Omnitrophota bacterium]